MRLVTSDVKIGCDNPWHGELQKNLQNRIRELEAELARTRADSMKWDVIQKGYGKKQLDRAELAWQRVEELAKKLGDEKARAEKADADKFISIKIASELTVERDALQARVAELEMAPCPCCGKPYAEHSVVEAREREAETDG